MEGKIIPRKVSDIRVGDVYYALVRNPHIQEEGVVKYRSVTGCVMKVTDIGRANSDFMIIKLLRTDGRGSIPYKVYEFTEGSSDRLSCPNVDFYSDPREAVRDMEAMHLNAVTPVLRNVKAVEQEYLLIRAEAEKVFGLQ